MYARSNMPNQLQSMTVTFEDEMEIKISASFDDLVIAPNIKTCVSYMYKMIFTNAYGLFPNVEFTHITIGAFHLEVAKRENKFEVKWDGENKPPIFLEFEKEWNRYKDMKAFW